MHSNFRQAPQNFDNLPPNISFNQPPPLPGKRNLAATRPPPLPRKTSPLTPEEMKVFDADDEDIIESLMVYSDGEFEPIPDDADDELAFMATDSIATVPGKDPSKSDEDAPGLPPLADTVYVNKVKTIPVYMLAVLLWSPSMRKLFHVMDSFKIRYVPGKLSHEHFPELPAGSSLRVTDLQNAGKRFLFKPEGEKDEDVFLMKKYEDSGKKSLLEFAVANCDVYKEFPGFYPPLQAAIMNAAKQTALMDHKVSAKILDSLCIDTYLQYPKTAPDMKVFIDCAAAHYGPEKGLRIAVNGAVTQLENALSLPPDQIHQSASMTALELPELLVGLSAEAQEAARELPRVHEKNFEAAYSRLKSPAVKIRKDYRGPKKVRDGIKTVSRFITIDGTAVEGAALYYEYTDPERNGPISDLMSKAARKDMADDVDQKPHLSQAPRFTCRLYEEGFFHLTSDSKVPVNMTRFASASRKHEVTARKDLTLEDKKRILADEILMNSVGAPEYAPGKRSCVILQSNRLGLGNTYDGSNQAFPGTNEQIGNIITGVLDAAAVERSIHTKKHK